MRRRDFISTALLGGAAIAWPLPLSAQKRTPRVGDLLNGGAVVPRDLDIAHELAQIGYIEGRNIIYEIRGAAGDLSRLPQLARELAATNPDAIVGSGTPAAAALFGATRNIPIVMTAVGDPIALGLTGSIARPTHNVTGFTVSSLSLAAKRLEVRPPTMERISSALFARACRRLAISKVKNVTIDFRSANNVYDRLPGMAAELVRNRVAIIVASGAAAAAHPPGST